MTPIRPNAMLQVAMLAMVAGLHARDQDVDHAGEAESRELQVRRLAAHRAERLAAKEAAAAPLREERLARKRAAFEKRQPR